MQNMKKQFAVWASVLALAVFADSVTSQSARGQEGEKKAPPAKEGRKGPGGGAGFGAPSNPLFDALDANKDGEISAEELSNAAAALKKLDKNGDGKLTRDEVRPAGGFGGGFGGGGGRAGFGGFGGGNMAEFIMSNDKNKDGKVTKDELPERMQAMFDRLDTNKDGAIDKEEAEKAAAGFGRGPGGRPGAKKEGGRPKRPASDAPEKAPDPEKKPDKQ